MARKVLVIDDTPAITSLVCEEARNLNFEAREVTRPREAIAAFLDFQPDVVVLEMLMPETDSIEILRQMLRTDPSVRLILISELGEGFLRLAASTGAVPWRRHCVAAP